MGNKKSRINFDPNEQLRDDATFLVQGKFGSKQLKLRDDMIVEDLNPQKDEPKELGYIFYNQNRETFTYLGYNGNVRSNILEPRIHHKKIKPNYDEYNRNFFLEKKNLDYTQLQLNHIKTRIIPEKSTNFPYYIYIINLEN